MKRLSSGFMSAVATVALGLLTVFGAAGQVQAAEPVTVAASGSDDDSGSLADFLAAIGGLGILAGPVFYLAVKRKYSLTDNDDAKDQAIQAALMVTASTTHVGDKSRMIQARFQNVKPQVYSKTRDKQTGRYVARTTNGPFGLDLHFG